MPRVLLALGLLALGFALPQAASATGASAESADFTGEPASADARRLADWALASGDHGGLPFLIVDKAAAKVFGFDDDGRLVGAAPALLGMGTGDVSPAGIGARRLATIAPSERITPAGRFVATLGENIGGQDILWVDYEAAVSLHRVIPGSPAERRMQRLATASTADNRISYGCINVPVEFYESVVRALFKATPGIVYILPETTPLHIVFPMAGQAQTIDVAR